MKKPLVLLVALALPLLWACDDGRIYSSSTTSREGLVVVLTGTIEGLDNWPSKYTIALAGFDEETAEIGEYSALTKAVSAADDGSLSVTLSGVTEDIRIVELCLLDRLRRRVVTFATLDMSETADTMYFDVGDQDVSMLNAIQQSVFNTTCSNCHGASTSAAAGLDLTEGNSYASLVSRTSYKDSTMLRVDPYSSESSVLYLVLTSDLTSSWLYDHSSEVTESTLLTLIGDWIDTGAPQD